MGVVMPVPCETATHHVAMAWWLTGTCAVLCAGLVCVGIPANDSTRLFVDSAVTVSPRERRTLCITLDACSESS